MPRAREEYAALLERARSGDPGALAALAHEYEPEVRIVARVLLGPALRPYLDSMDLVQSVHKSLLLGLRNDKLDLSSPERLVALALTMVRRKVARHWRHLRRQQRLSKGPPARPDLVEVLSSLSRSPPDPAQAAAFHDEVAHLCGHLDETERRLLELRLQGCSTREAADELGLDADVLRVRLSRLRQRLRACGVVTECL
jgi:RNA polymerase sigma-70 factor (ECF subfamily)